MAHGTCVLESDFGFILNCNFKKSSLFRVRNLGGVKAHFGLGKISILLSNYSRNDVGSMSWWVDVVGRQLMTPFMDDTVAAGPIQINRPHLMRCASDEAWNSRSLHFTVGSHCPPGNRSWARSVSPRCLNYLLFRFFRFFCGFSWSNHEGHWNGQTDTSSCGAQFNSALMNIPQS